MKKIKKILKQPVTIGNFLLVAATAIVVILAMGAKGEDTGLKAYAATLNPTPIPQASVTPLVKTEVVKVAAVTPEITPAEKPSESVGSSGDLVGSIGYAKRLGNCVNTARAHGKSQQGNPISWSITTHTPFIGAAALFHYNHVAIVVGIWDNGDIEVIHENFAGSQHRFSQSEIRGYF